MKWVGMFSNGSQIVIRDVDIQVSDRHAVENIITHIIYDMHQDGYSCHFERQFPRGRSVKIDKSVIVKGG
jgi:hypothetical protein